MKSDGNETRVLAVVAGVMRESLTRQLAPLATSIVCVGMAAEVTRLVREGSVFDVAILPATLADGEWWALWGELCLLNARPAILVYTRSPTFQLWSGVLEMGGYDVIVEPFSDEEIQEAVSRAAQNFRERVADDGTQT